MTGREAATVINAPGGKGNAPPIGRSSSKNVSKVRRNRKRRDRNISSPTIVYRGDAGKFDNIAVVSKTVFSPSFHEILTFGYSFVDIEGVKVEKPAMLFLGVVSVPICQ
jgi:hypothetical protein